MASTTGALDSAYSNALGTAVSNATGGSDLGKEEFLQLLVTQFQYQDPLKTRSSSPSSPSSPALSRI